MKVYNNKILTEVLKFLKKYEQIYVIEFNQLIPIEMKQKKN